MLPTWVRALFSAALVALWLVVATLLLYRHRHRDVPRGTFGPRPDPSDTLRGGYH